MNSPKVSVLMTAFNREDYIKDAIESVLASSYSNLELIIVDDGSTDATVSIIDKYTSADSRVKLYINEKNLGDYPNRNRAASYATGKYLKYIDSDDYIYPWGLELLIKMMEENPGAGWGLCSFEQDDENPYPFLLTPSEAYKYHYGERGIFIKAPLSSIITRECFEKLGGFRPIRMAGDFDMWHRLAKHFPVLLMPQGIVWSRVHFAQESSDSGKTIGLYEELKIEHLSSEDCPLERKLRIKFIKSQRNRLIKAGIKNLLLFKISKAILHIKSLMPYYSVSYNKLGRFGNL